MYPCRGSLTSSWPPQFFSNADSSNAAIPVYQSRGQEAPRGPVPDDAGTGRPAASSCRLSSTGIPTSACRRGRAARTTAASPPARGTGLVRPGPTAARLSPREVARPQPQSEHQGHDIQTNARTRASSVRPSPASPCWPSAAARQPDFGEPLQGLTPDLLARFQAGKTAFWQPRTYPAAWGPSSTTPPAPTATARAPSAAAATAWRPGTAR